MPQSISSSYIDREVIILTQDGIWLADGDEITHEPTRKLFAKSLKHDAEGYFLAIGRETKRIEVEDTAYFVERMDEHPEDLRLSISDESVEMLDPKTLNYRLGRLTAKIKNGQEEAKFLRAPYYELLKKAHEEAGAYYLVINGKKTFLGGIFD
jgi:hypothetical protein